MRKPNMREKKQKQANKTTIGENNIAAINYYFLVVVVAILISCIHIILALTSGYRFLFYNI